MSHSLLIVDDEQSLLDFLRLLFEGEGYEVTTAGSLAEADSLIADDGFDLVLCDILMPEGSGLDLLRKIKQRDPRASVIMMTAYSSTRSAIEAMRLGAFDYIAKPFEVEELKVVAQRAVEAIELADENIYLRRELEDKYQFENIIGRSSRMQAVFALVERVAPTTSTVLIQGESGTGKELIARAIHYTSPRARHRFLSINCGAMPENLLESELFGHERGAFTGAVREKAGLFQEAHEGTIFLDEIGEMSSTMQVKLLRTLQERVVRKVGGTREEAVDVRVIAATNQDLTKRIGAGDFREDLYYRINVIPIELPPLRQRREDIPLLVDFFLKKFADQVGVAPKRISLDAMRHLESYDWPGNVRELENVIERAMALAQGEVINRTDLPARILYGSSSPGDGVTLPEGGFDLETYLDDVRRKLMAQALERTNGVQTQAASLLGMSFRSFRYYAKKLGLTGS